MKKKIIIMFDNSYKRKHIIISNLKTTNKINIKKNNFELIKINQSIKSLELLKREKDDYSKKNIKFLKKYEKKIKKI